MTGMRAAFQKAGLDTARVELEQKVRDLLARNKGRPEGIIVGFDSMILRRRDLREVMLLDYATRIAGDGQTRIDDHAGNAVPGDVGHGVGDDLSLHADAPGPLGADNHSERAGGKKYKREPVHHVRSEAQKLAAREAMASSLGIWSRKIGDRPIGEITWGELRALRRDSITRAGEMTLGAIYLAADALLIGKILDHAQVKDMATKVKDVISERDLQRLNHEAAKEAPDVAKVGRVVYESTLTKQIENRP